MTPEDANARRKLDEAATVLCDSLPSLWWGLYRGCVSEGFSESQAMTLVKSFVEGQARATSGGHG